MADIKEPTIKLQRHLLASLDLSDLEDKMLSESERKDYVAAIFAVWPRLEKDLKKFMYDQLMFASQKATTWEEVLFARGTFNGMDLIFEHWKIAANEFEASASEAIEDRKEED